MPAFPTLSYLRLSSNPSFEATHDLTSDSRGLGVRKVGMPPLFGLAPRLLYEPFRTNPQIDRHSLGDRR